MLSGTVVSAVCPPLWTCQEGHLVHLGKPGESDFCNPDTTRVYIHPGVRYLPTTADLKGRRRGDESRGAGRPDIMASYLTWCL